MMDFLFWVLFCGAVWVLLSAALAPFIGAWLAYRGEL